jgi:hypothetical protein
VPSIVMDASPALEKANGLQGSAMDKLDNLVANHMYRTAASAGSSRHDLVIARIATVGKGRRGE